MRGRWLAVGCVGVIGCASAPTSSSTEADDDGLGSDRGSSGAGRPETDLGTDDTGIAGVDTDRPPTGLVDDPASQQTMTMELTLSYELTGVGVALCTGPSAVLDSCTCAATWRGWGARIGGTSTRTTFEGRFEGVSDDCEPLGADQPSFSAQMFAGSDGVAYHSLNWAIRSSGEVGGLRSWVVHAENTPSAGTPGGAASPAEQGWIEIAKSAALVDGRVRHDEVVTLTPSPGVSVIRTTALAIDVATTATYPPFPSGDPAPPVP